MAWSDPCNYDTPTGDDTRLGFDCNLGTGEVEGWDGGNLTLDATLLLGSNSVFAWNSGKKIALGTLGKIGTIANPINGGKLEEANLYYTDQDGDGYPPANRTMYAVTGPAPAGAVRVYVARNRPNDCLDSGTGAAQTFPGQTSFFATPNGLGNYDYNCDGNGDSGASNPSAGGGQCDTNSNQFCTQFYEFPIENPNYNGRVGFTTSVSCGSQGTYVVDPGAVCGSPPRSCVTETRTYTCALATKQYSQGGACHSYPGPNCPLDPIPGAQGAPGFVGTVNCGNTATYVSDPGGCFPPDDGGPVRSCVTQPSGTYYQSCR